MVLCADYFSGQALPTKDPTVWVDGGRPQPKVLTSNFKQKINLSFASIKEISKTMQMH